MTRDDHLFAPTAYVLDARRVLNLPLKHGCAAGDGTRNIVDSTIAGVLSILADPSKADQPPLGIDQLVQAAASAVVEIKDGAVVTLGGDMRLGTAITTEAGVVYVAGPVFHREIFAALLRLAKVGVDPFESLWYWYDREITPEGAPLYDFFLVNSGRIVDETVSFLGNSDIRCDTGFTPDIFEVVDDAKDGDGHWSRVLAHRREARDRFWYRRFYRDTQAGQLMVLRPDEPKLHHYPEGRWRPDVAFAVLQESIATTQIGLWLLLILVTLGLVRLWR